MMFLCLNAYNVYINAQHVYYLVLIALLVKGILEL